MKKTILIVIALLVAATTFAQEKKDAPTPEVRAEKRTAQLTKKLELTETQIPQVKAITLEHIQKSQAIKESTEKGEARRTQMKQLIDETNKKMEAVLTPDQYATYIKMQEEKKEKMKERQKEKPKDKE